jgi:hypothetical protein
MIEKSEKKDGGIFMLSQNSFFGEIFYRVRRIIVFFASETIRIEEIIKEMEDLKNYVKENHQKVCDWGYSCDYVPYREQCAAMNVDVLEEILKIAKLQNRDILSQHLWRLIDGWSENNIIELFLKRMRVKPVVSYERENYIDEELALKKKLENFH